ncbi:hypothetical protein Taro_010740 [Colocasia esculenta]|uniref:Uncharacterized protein n=1 Tax=Colocasia esculenta TaxID=4460 RepID=A0A843U7V6_COLES|nr:hypothetical protein [Colocasia esculenta]
MVTRVNHKFHVVLTQCFKYKANRSSSVDTSPGSVDTRDSSQNTFWPSWDSVSTLAQVDTGTGSVDTSGPSRTKHMVRSQQTKHGKKNDLVWMISFTPATKNFSIRPQQVLKLVPKISFYDRIKASLTLWYILGSPGLVLQHRTIWNTVVTTTTSQACPELLPAFLSSVSPIPKTNPI